MNLDECVEQAFNVIDPDVALRFATNPLQVMIDNLGLTVTAVDHLTDVRDGGGACDGVSYLDDDLVLYAATPGSRRENFTLAHEVGHWLVEQAPAIYDWVADQPSPAQLLETICDHVAQRLLLPESSVTAVIGDGPVRARHLLDLFGTTAASRPVCAIGLARHLGGVGAVAIIDRFNERVEYASIVPHPEHGWPKVYPWPGQQVPSAHPLLRVQPESSHTRKATWQTPWRAAANFYVDAIADDRRIYVVFSAVDMWGIERFHAPDRREFDNRPSLTGRCCGEAFERRGYPCETCGEPYCPTCGSCRCDRQARREVTCSNCFMKVAPHLVVDGVCESCA